MTMLAPSFRQGLTAMQVEFVRLFIETGERERATIEAGYSGEPSVVAWRLLRTPAVVAAIRLQTVLRLQEIAPVALPVLEGILVDESAPKSVRVDAAKTLLDRAGHIAPKARDPDNPNDRPLNDRRVSQRWPCSCRPWCNHELAGADVVQWHPHPTRIEPIFKVQFIVPVLHQGKGNDG